MQTYARELKRGCNGLLQMGGLNQGEYNSRLRRLQRTGFCNRKIRRGIANSQCGKIATNRAFFALLSPHSHGTLDKSVEYDHNAEVTRLQQSRRSVLHQACKRTENGKAFANISP